MALASYRLRNVQQENPQDVAEGRAARPLRSGCRRRPPARELGRQVGQGRHRFGAVHVGTSSTRFFVFPEIANQLQLSLHRARAQPTLAAISSTV